MKKKITSVCIVLIFLVGFGIMLYPTVSNWVNERNQSRAVASYSDAVSNMVETDYSQYLEAAVKHNEKIAQAGSLADALRMEKENELEEYYSLLDVNGIGIMGVVRIPKIKVSLPIYHTTDEGVLQVGVGHFTGSSLPVGGESTHCILSGHRGLPSAKLFTDLDQIVEGDVFYMDVLGDTLAYQVDQIQVVLPEEVDSLNVVEGEDYVTLITCTPYGVNTHRLLVRGTRIPYVQEEEAAAAQAPVTSEEPQKEIPLMPIIAAAAMVIAVAAGTVCGNLSRKRSKKKKSKQKKGSKG